MAVQHLRLVCVSLFALILLALSRVRQQAPRPASVQQLFVLNGVLSIAACSLLFCSTGFAIAGILLLYRTPKHARAGLHFTDTAPSKTEQRAIDRTTATQTLVAANWACVLAFFGLFYALRSLRWALPPLPAWGTSASSVLCAINLCTGAILAAKNSRWAPWLLPGAESIPLNEPCRFVAFLEQVHTKCLSPRPNLPRSRSCGTKRAMRRSASWDSFPGSPPEPCALFASPPSTKVIEDGKAKVEVVVVSDCNSGAAALNENSVKGITDCTWSTNEEQSPNLYRLQTQPTEGHSETETQGCTAQRSPPRGIGRTYSEDMELDTSIVSTSSSNSNSNSSSSGSSGSSGSSNNSFNCDAFSSSSIEGDPRMFLDVLQANIMSHTDDTLQFLARVSPEKQPLAQPTLDQVQPPAFVLPQPSPTKQTSVADVTSHRASDTLSDKMSDKMSDAAVDMHSSKDVFADSDSRQHLAELLVSQEECSLVAPPLLKLPQRLSKQPTRGCEAIGEESKQMTQVSATVDQLLDAIVGELV